MPTVIILTFSLLCWSNSVMCVTNCVYTIENYVYTFWIKYTEKPKSDVLAANYVYTIIDCVNRKRNYVYRKRWFLEKEASILHNFAIIFDILPKTD